MTWVKVQRKLVKSSKLQKVKQKSELRLRRKRGNVGIVIFTKVKFSVMVRNL